MTTRVSLGIDMAKRTFDAALLQEGRKRGALLQSIPGIGECTALKLLAELPSPLQCRNARQVAAYAGLCPRQRESGSSIRGENSVEQDRQRAVTQSPPSAGGRGDALQSDPANVCPTIARTRQTQNGGGWSRDAQTPASSLWGAQTRPTL